MPDTFDDQEEQQTQLPSVPRMSSLCELDVVALATNVIVIYGARHLTQISLIADFADRWS
jgi:hypothetical protein